MRWVVADFETTDEKFYLENGYTRVWLWAISDSEGNILSYGSSILDFMSYIQSNLNHTTIYFHNLKFDGSYIIDYLLMHSYQFFEKLNDTTRGYNCLIDDNGAWYEIKYKWNKTCLITFRDSLKLLPFKVEKIAKDFKLKYLKGKIDYSNYEITAETLEYVFNDVRIVALALQQVFDEGMVKMTTASCAYHDFKACFSDRYFNYNFPTLEKDFLIEWRKAYRGGRTQVNPLYKDKKLKGVRRYDINSMYPSVMYYNELPYGYPVECKEPGNFKFELYHIRIEFTLKDGHIPTLLQKGSKFREDSYYIDSDGIEELWISNIDLQLVYRHYHVFYIEYLQIYGFYTTTLLFLRYVSKWYKRKQVDEGAKKIVDKLMLNSLYGKFGSNVMRGKRIPYLDEEENVVLQDEPYEEGTHYYLPMAIAIVSYAHKRIDDAIVATGEDKFVYCDTDSVHTLGSLPSEWIDDKELGKFKYEAYESSARYVRQKCYVTNEKNEWHITCAGMPENSKQLLIDKYGDDIINKFTIGLSVGGKLLPKRVKGGVILHETEFTITA